MGLRCSLLGHDYGEATTERDREERGGEVVAVERDLQVCSRCGTEKVLSENTEVRTLSSPEQDEPDRTQEAESADDSVAEPAGASASEPSGSPVGESSGTAGVVGDTDVTPSTPPEHAPSADEDDAVILDDEPDQERDRSQWPDEAQQEAMSDVADTGEPAPEPAPWPDQDGEDEGFDAKPTADDDDAGVEFGGLTPEAADVAEADDEGYVEAPSEPAADTSSPTRTPSQDATVADDRPGTAPEADDEAVEDTGFTSAGPVNPPAGRTDDADTLLVCPECGFERRAARASLRAGDICPECRRGYLAERR